MTLDQAIRQMEHWLEMQVAEVQQDMKLESDLKLRTGLVGIAGTGEQYSSGQLQAYQDSLQMLRFYELQNTEGQNGQKTEGK